MTDQVAAAIATIILFILGVFQISLIAKLPLGQFAWGGTNKVLSDKQRVASFFTLFLYTLFAVIILEKAELISFLPYPWITNISIWILTAFFGIEVVINSISRSKFEKLIMTPIALLLTLFCLILSLN